MNTVPQDINKELTQQSVTTNIGATSETAAATDTTTSGLNGLFKRLLQRITTLITAIGSPFQAGGSIANTSFLAVPTDGTKATYSASTLNLITDTSATDIFTITGSGTKTIRIHKIIVSATRTVSGNIDLLLIKRSTANTGGTSSAATIVPFDSTNVAATAIVNSYTANPTLGTTVGIISNRKVFLNTVTTGITDYCVYEFGNLNQCVVLRGTSQVLAINLNATTITGSSFNISIEFIEE
jgi:hypothetical protein